MGNCHLWRTMIKGIIKKWVMAQVKELKIELENKFYIEKNNF